MKSTMRQRKLAVNGFTLVELLVVIGIIALLISILLPALGKARKQAKKVQCLSNLNQMSLAFAMYTTQYKRSVPFYQVSGNGALWIGALASMNSSVTKAQLCPEASDPFNVTTPPIADRTGSAFNCWGPSSFTFLTNTNTAGVTTYYTGSYGINGYLYWYNTATPPTRGATPSFSSGGRIATTLTVDYTIDYLSPTTWVRSTEVPAFADANWTDGWPSNTDTVPYDTKVGTWLANDTGMPNQDNGANQGDMGRYCLARHGKAINVAFVDGHAETVPLQRLWALHWFNRYTPPNPLPAVPGPNN